MEANINLDVQPEKKMVRKNKVKIIMQFPKHCVVVYSKFLISDNCNHARSTLYYIESLSTKVKAKEAFYTEFEHTASLVQKENGKEVIFGQHIDINATGVYVFKTNSKQPFLQ